MRLALPKVPCGLAVAGRWEDPLKSAPATKGKLIGRGTFGSVHTLMQNGSSNKAVKLVHCLSTADPRALWNEAHALRTLQGHDNVVKLDDVFSHVRDTHALYAIVMEKCFTNLASSIDPPFSVGLS